jgi:Flp pilus assembly protein TadG
VNAAMRRRYEGVRSESGQAIVLTMLLLPALFLVAGLVIDYGSSVVLQRKAQAAADASAMAAIWNLPLGLTAMQSAGSAMFAANATGLTLTPTISPSTVDAQGDSVSVTVSGTRQTLFVRLIGINTVAVHASARATAQSVLGCAATGCDIVSWGIPDCASTAGGLDCSQPLQATLGQRVTLKTDSGASGKFYGLAAPVLNGSACTAASGAGDYSRAIIGKWASNGMLTCNVKAAGPASSGYSTAGCSNVNTPSLPSCVVQVKAGNMVGPTASGLTTRLGCSSSGVCNNDTLSYITGGCDPRTAYANLCSVIHDSPRLVVVPVVRNLDNTTGYNQCSSGQNCIVKVVDLVYFYIDASYADIQGNTVTGTFFRSTAPPTFGLVGPYNGGIFMRAALSG